MGGGKRLIIIYLVFNMAYVLLDAATEGFSVKRLLIPSFALWYILSLIFWRLALQILPQKWIDKPVYVITGSIMISLLAGIVPIGSEMSFQRTLTFWPFFIAGFYLRKYGCIEKIRHQNKWVSGTVFMVLLVVAYLWLSPFYANSPYGIENAFSGFCMRGVQLLMAALMCFCVLVITPEKLGKITDVGQYTLIIYLLHPPVVKTLKVISTRVGHDPDLLIALLITVITVMTIYSVRKLKIFKYLT